jgi:hypothetical protein
VWQENKKPDPMPKVTRLKRIGDMGQVVEHLPNKHEALNSNSSITKQKVSFQFICPIIVWIICSFGIKF